MVVWAEAVATTRPAPSPRASRTPAVKTFGHHQEHLEERIPGGKKERLAHVSAQGKNRAAFQQDSVFAANNLEDGRFVSFGNGRVETPALGSLLRLRRSIRRGGEPGALLPLPWHLRRDASVR